ncbi:MAG TPA: hypothetical protein PKX36_04435, partial [Candidatus Cloacimonadota bacterium]|nr:hypothetical protein [Candidatus Cloacimonadota bacterium]
MKAAEMSFGNSGLTNAASVRNVPKKQDSAGKATMKDRPSAKNLRQKIDGKELAYTITPLPE